MANLLKGKGLYERGIYLKGYKAGVAGEKLNKFWDAVKNNLFFRAGYHDGKIARLALN
jgi:hypothetical protein